MTGQREVFEVCRKYITYGHLHRVGAFILILDDRVQRRGTRRRVIVVRNTEYLRSKIGMKLEADR